METPVLLEEREGETLKGYLERIDSSDWPEGSVYGNGNWTTKSAPARLKGRRSRSALA